MSNYYVSEGERQYLEQRKAESEAMVKWATAKNTSLVGEIKTYKGISYQMQQRGSFVCINLPPNSVLEGSFTTAFALHKFIDNMEPRQAK